MPEQATEHGQALRQKAEPLSRQRLPAPLRPDVGELVAVAIEQGLGLVGFLHAAAPHVDDVVVGQQEVHVGLALRVVDDAALLLQPVQSGVLGSACSMLKGVVRRQSFEIYMPP